MPDGRADISTCEACGKAMDTSAVGPFTNVECPTCGAQSRVKRQFGPYALVRRYAIGGMSMVFLARDNTLGRDVVVKILSEEYSADERRIGAFEEEARITAAISHPHVVRVFTTGRAFGRFYIAMEFVPGGHFEGHIRDRGSIPETEALPLAIEVAEGLKAAHAAGLIHRDVKPGNILLDAHRSAKIVDFGLALVTKGGLAQATEIWATPYYVPPETIDRMHEDFRSDIYAFGATFYHALAGSPPCDEESMDTNRLRDAKRRIIPLEKIAPHLNRATCAAINRAMAYEPVGRFGSYDELIAALRTALQMVENGIMEPAKTTKNRRRASAGVGRRTALLLGAVAMIGAIGFTWHALTREETRGGASVEGGSGLAALVSVDPVPQEGTDGGMRVAKAYREAGVALAAGDFGEAGRLFEAVRDDPEVMEPTGSWAACEAVIAAWLDGRPPEGRRRAAAALEHLESADTLQAELAGVLSEALQSLRRVPAVPVPESFEGQGPAYLAWLMAGLKNWEQGMPEQAAPYFEAIATAGGSENWLAPYRRIAGDYLGDLERLREAEPAVHELDEDGCRERIAELADLHERLATRGRAKFNVRVWQHELEKRLRRIVREATPADGRPAGLDQDFAAFRFAEAREKLVAWQPANEQAERNRQVLSALVDAAVSFLAELEEDSASGVDGVILETRDGTKLAAIAGVGESGPNGVDENGASVAVAWSDLTADSLIELHRRLVRDESVGLERLRRHEQAVAFDLLAGNAERAREAARVLSDESATFKARWDRYLPVIQP